MIAAMKTRFRVKHTPVSQGRAELNPLIKSVKAKKRITKD